MIYRNRKFNKKEEKIKKVRKYILGTKDFLVLLKYS